MSYEIIKNNGYDTVNFTGDYFVATYSGEDVENLIEVNNSTMLTPKDYLIAGSFEDLKLLIVENSLILSEELEEQFLENHE